MLLYSRKKLRDRDAEAVRDGERRHDRKVVLPSLNAAHVGPMESAMVREGFLRKALLPPEFTNAVPEEHLQFLHFQQFASAYTVCLHATCRHDRYSGILVVRKEAL